MGRLHETKSAMFSTTQLNGDSNFKAGTAFLMVLAAIPLLFGIGWALIRSARRREERNKEEALY